MPTQYSNRHAGLAILGVVTAASLGIAVRLFLPGIVGQLCFVITRVGLLVFPVVWFYVVEQGSLIFTPPSWRECLVGVLLGLLMGGLILSAYTLLGSAWINVAVVQAKAQQIGITSPTVYGLSAGYFTGINALIEEYIWRWFVGRNATRLVGPIGAIGLSALCFTLHHAIALAAYTGNGLVVLVGSLGVFGAGAVWAWRYTVDRSLWGCYLSHVLADLAIALVGWDLLFPASRPA